MQIFKHTNYDFLRWRWHAVALLAGDHPRRRGRDFTKGIPRGIEFAGGTVVISRFDQEVSVQQVRAALDQTFGGQNVDGPDLRRSVAAPDHGARAAKSAPNRAASLSSGAEKVEAGAAGRPTSATSRPSRTEIVGPAVGRELTSKGIRATVLSLVGILVYIAFRYQLSFAVGAVVATVHDLLVTLAFLAFFQYDITLNVIAAILTVTGYSTNDTIVIFDRVRENLKGMRRDSLGSRHQRRPQPDPEPDDHHAGTALLSALALFVFGGEVLRGFAFTMMVGIITGTYSSIFVAAAIVTIWRGKSPTRAASHAPARSVRGTAPQQPTRKSKPQRKARAS